MPKTRIDLCVLKRLVDVVLFAFFAYQVGRQWGAHEVGVLEIRLKGGDCPFLRMALSLSGREPRDGFS